MDTPKISRKLVKALYCRQMEGLGERPDLAADLPYPPAAMEHAAARLNRIEMRQQRLKMALVIATESVRRGYFDLRDRLRRNISSAESRLGRYARDLAYLGATPLRGTHRSPSGATAGPAAEGGKKE